MAPTKKEWTKTTVPLSYLQDKAAEWDWGVFLSSSEETATMVNFLRWCGLVPEDVNWKRKNSLPRTSLDRNTIPVGYLAEVAYEWDQDGFSDAADYVRAIEFEVNGTAANNSVSQVMEELGR